MFWGGFLMAFKFFFIYWFCLHICYILSIPLQPHTYLACATFTCVCFPAVSAEDDMCVCLALSES